MCHCSALRLFAFHACGKGLRWSTPREHEHVEALARYSSQLEQWKTRSARQIQRVNLLKVVQPLVWRLLGLHKIQMQVEVKKRRDAFSKVCHVMISTLGGYGWSQLDGWIDQSYIQYHAWSLRWLIHHSIKYFHTHIRFLDLFGLFGGVRLSWCRPFLECIHSSLYIAFSMSIQQSQSMNLDLKHAVDYRLDMTRLFNMSGW